jgi:hypothetical protein
LEARVHDLFDCNARCIAWKYPGESRSAESCLVGGRQLKEFEVQIFRLAAYQDARILSLDLERHGTVSLISRETREKSF